MAAKRLIQIKLSRVYRKFRNYLNLVRSQNLPLKLYRSNMKCHQHPTESYHRVLSIKFLIKKVLDPVQDNSIPYHKAV